MTPPIEKPVDEWVVAPKNQYIVLRWGNGDVLVYAWVKGKLGGCLAAYLWTGSHLHPVIGAIDPQEEFRIIRHFKEQAP